MGSGVSNAASVPLRRWEDWERSRLRKTRREEKRRREMARAFPNGYQGSEYLHATGDTQSQYDGSDTVSMVSSEEDHWGGQIGTYNENSSQYPPPPPGLLLPHQEMITTAKTVGKDELAAMLESGFDDRPTHDMNASMTALSSTSHLLDPNGAPAGTARYQLSDAPPPPRFNAYAPAPRQGSPARTPPRHVVSPTSPMVPVNGTSSAVSGEWRTHAKKRSGGRAEEEGGGGYGPLGPLDPGSRF
jgi:chitin synthase